MTLKLNQQFDIYAHAFPSKNLFVSLLRLGGIVLYGKPFSWAD